MINHAHSDYVSAGLHKFARHSVFTGRGPEAGSLDAADLYAIEPGHVHVINRPQLERERFAGVPAGNLNRPPEPDRAVVTRQSRCLVESRKPHRVPLGIVKRGREPLADHAAIVGIELRAPRSHLWRPARLGLRFAFFHHLFRQRVEQLFFVQAGQFEFGVVDEFHRAVPRGLRRAAMDLESYFPGQLALGIVYCDAQGAVDGRPNPVFDRQYFVAVPVASFHGLGGPVVPVQLAAPVLMVQFPPDASAHVSLITKRLAGGIRLLRAKLNARIAVVRSELDVDRQVKVPHFAVSPNKFILRHIHRRMPDDGIVLHRPILRLRS